MKFLFTCTAALLVSVFIIPAAQAKCTRNPFQMGWDAAEQACDDIAQSFVPEVPPGGGYYDKERTMAEPEKTCSIDDVVKCKNAMSQYLRENRSCASLIRRNVELESRAGGSRAKDVWRSYSSGTCNQ